MKLLHLISYPEFFDGELEHVVTILKSTEVVFHLRKPKESVEAYAAFVRQIPEVYYQHLILHSAYYLTEEFDFAGLHFSTHKRAIADKLAVALNNNTSCHSLLELRTLPKVFNSCFLSSVYKSISKEGYTNDLDLNEVSDYLSKKHRLQVIALGGICQENLHDTLAMGFDGVAVLGTVWGDNPCPKDNFLERVLTLVKMLKMETC